MFPIFLIQASGGAERPAMQTPIVCTATGGLMSGLSRRSFLHASAAAGAAAVAAMPAVRAVAASPNHHTVDSPANGSSHATPAGPIVVYVNDARKGQISVLSGESETVTNDPDLVRRIVRAANA
jgi:hypothetical protein